MARFFQYKAPGELQAAADELGQPLSLAPSAAPLFEPFRVGGRTVGNRLVVQPMEGCDGTLDGAPDELTFRRYRRFGAGGAKLIWGEATAVSADARANTRQLWLSPRTAPAIEQMLAECRSAHREACGDDRDLLLGLQLTHSGRYSVPRPLLATTDPLLDPLTYHRAAGRPVNATDPRLTDAELRGIADQYVTAARLAQQVGCDFVDIKQCHHYLLSELLSARNRPGPYGGSLENRTRLVREIVTRIRAEVPGLLLFTRMNCYDGIPFRGELIDGERRGRPVPCEGPVPNAFGTDPNEWQREDLTEPIAVARELVQLGVAMVNVTMGNPYANPHVVRPAEYPPVDGYLPPEHPLLGVLRHLRIAAAMQAALPGVPVVGSGYSWLQDFAHLVAAGEVAAGRVTCAGFGRATLSHPDFANALKEQGRFDRKQVCRTFSYCTGLMRAKDHPLGQYPTGCPPFDKEAYGAIWKEVEAKRST